MSNPSSPLKLPKPPDLYGFVQLDRNAKKLHDFWGPGFDPWVTEHSQLPILGVALAPDVEQAWAPGNFSAATHRDVQEKLVLCAGGEDGRTSAWNVTQQHIDRPPETSRI